MSYSITAGDLISQSAKDLGILSQGETLDASTTQDMFAKLQQLIDAWNLESLTVLVVNRTVYTLTSNQQTYTIGPAVLTPDFSTGTAARPVRLEGAGLVLNYTTPSTEIPLFLLTDDLYQSIGIKALTSTQPTQVYYNPTNPLGTVFLWPNPTTGVNALALYTQELTAKMSALSTIVVMPPGYARAFRLALCVECSTPAFGVPLDPNIDRLAMVAKRNLKAANVKITDLTIDAALQPMVPGGSYNILSDQGA